MFVAGPSSRFEFGSKCVDCTDHSAKTLTPDSLLYGQKQNMVWSTFLLELDPKTT